MTDRQPMDPTDAFAELGRIKLSETDVDGVLHTIAELAKRTIPGTDEVSVTLIRGKGAIHRRVHRRPGPRAGRGAVPQGHGPCLDAASPATASPCRTWPPRAAGPTGLRGPFDVGVHSSLSIGLPIHETVTGALNVYATKPDNFDEDAIILAQTFAGYAAVALANAHLYDMTATLAQHMQAAMESRAVIEQAKGIIMGERRCTADEAFQILSKLSQDTNRKVREVAAALVARAQQTPGS